MKDASALLKGIDDHLLDQDINPSREFVFSALRCNPESIKVIILGQDPYPDSNHANGLAFSVPPKILNLPPSLRNIFKEYAADLTAPTPSTGDLSPWADQGVLLLNSALTCRPGESLSHSEIGWQNFTQALLEAVITPTTVGILWGRHAAKYRGLFSPDMRIESAHPSPLSAYRGFFGSRPFTRANELLLSKGITPVDWTLQSA
jgi:uracil-DNA glycosylase